MGLPMKEKKYINDYHAITEESKSGRIKTRYRYAGQYFSADRPASFKKICQWAVAFTSLSLIMAATSVSLEADSTYSAFVVLPAVIAVIFQTITLFKLWGIWSSAKKMTRKQLDAVLDSVFPLWAAAVSMVAALIARLIYTAINGTFSVIAEVIGLALCSGAVAAAFFAAKVYSKIKVSDEAKSQTNMLSQKEEKNVKAEKPVSASERVGAAEQQPKKQLKEAEQTAADNKTATIEEKPYQHIAAVSKITAQPKAAAEEFITTVVISLANDE